MLPAAAVAKGKEGWLYFTVPEKPVAGAKCALYFNRQQSEALRWVVRLWGVRACRTWVHMTAVRQVPACQAFIHSS